MSAIAFILINGFYFNKWKYEDYVSYRLSSFALLTYNFLSIFMHECLSQMPILYKQSLRFFH